MVGVLTMSVEQIFEIDSLDELNEYLQSLPAGQTRRQLKKLFFENVRYQNLSQWNRTVRLCEALTIVGWGDLEPVQAIRTKFDNGCPWTKLRNRYWDYRYIDAWWSKRKDGFMMTDRRIKDHGSDDLPTRLCRKPFVATFEKEQGTFDTQRNWILRSPICVWRTLTMCYESSVALMDSAKKLDAKLHSEMRPEVYGREIDQLRFYYHLSYGEPDYGSANNFVIQEDDEKLNKDERQRRLRKLYSASEIKKMRYDLKPRYDFRPFRRDSGCMNIGMFFPKEFSEQSTQRQKTEFAEVLIDGIAAVVEKLRKKKLNYDLDTMQADAVAIVKSWARGRSD